MSEHSFDPILSNMLLKNLFTYFTERGWIACKVNGLPYMIHEDNVSSGLIYQQLYTLGALQEAGIEYVKEFLSVTMDLLLDHPIDYERA